MTQVNTSFPRLFFGNIHYGSKSGKKFKSKGKIDTYARINFKVSVTAVNKDEQRNRAKLLKAILEHMANGGQEDSLKLLSLLLKSSPSLYEKSIRDAGYNIYHNMEVHQAIQLKSLLHLPMNSYINFKRIMVKFGYTFLPSEHRLRVEQEKLVPHITKDAFVVDKMYLNTTGEWPNLVSVLRVSDLNQYILDIVHGLKAQQKLQFDELFNGYIWLLFSGDRGGKHMKFHFEVINSSDAGSVFNVHIIAMYEGSDCYQNMAQVLLPFHEALVRLQSDEFSICGHKVKVFLRG